MRVAYLLLSHRPPAQLRRLLSTLRRLDPEAALIVHHDRFRCTVAASDIDVGGQFELLTSDHPIDWGDFSQVDVYWRMLRWIVEKVDFDWVVLLSAQDYPIKPLRELYAMLESTTANAILEAQSVSDTSDRQKRADLESRYYYHYARPMDLGIRKHLPRAAQKALHVGAAFGADVINRTQSAVHVYKYPEQQGFRLGVRSRRRPFTLTAPCWYGSCWSTLSHKSAQALLGFVDDNPSFVSYYQSTVAPDESASTTILSNDASTRLMNANLHHTRWSDPMSGHPDVFQEKDFDELRASPKYFARKFDISVDEGVLDRLDESLFGS